YALWRDPQSPNGYRLGVRRGITHDLVEYPLLSLKNEARLVPTPPEATLRESTSSSTNTTRPSFVASFWRPLRITDDPSDISIPANGTLSYIWAVSQNSPTPASSPSALLTQHDQMGSFQMNFMYEPPEPSTTITWDPSTSTGTYCADDKLTFCVHMAINLFEGTCTMTLQTVYDGWIGVGVGSSTMRGADMYLSWPSATLGQVITSQRRLPPPSAPLDASNNTTTDPSTSSSPIVVPSPDYTPLPTTPSFAQIHESAQLNYTFTRPLNTLTSSINPRGLTEFIWAVASFGPSPEEGEGAVLYQHSFAGGFQLDLRPEVLEVAK
ncbi:hypothetical protein HDV05_008823, partial [Chytridiales sp. JEL 0842]